jgi:tyrosinase
VAHVRKNQAQLTSEQWDAFIGAVNALHGNAAAPPRYRQFVQVHVDAMSPEGMAWSVHSMPGMVGTNFLAWHRQFLFRLERRLRRVESRVTLPYWDWIADPAIPVQLRGQARLQDWSITREWDPSFLPTQADVDAAMARTTFASFQRWLEQVHNNVHLAVGGTMSGASSPADPLFFLHHANIDRLWARWQRAHPRRRPSNTGETLRPRPLFGVKVRDVLSVSNLGYRYG